VAQAPALTNQEVEQYYEELGIILTEEEKSQIAAIVKPIEPLPQWRIEANHRIDLFRKADLMIEVVYADGDPVENASVSISLKKNAFHFGVVVRAEDLTDSQGRLAAAGSSADEWQSRVLALSNAVGTGNNFKPKLTSLHEYLPGFLDWTEAHDLYVRGHLLIWPGSKGIEEMDVPGNVIGVDYGKHLSLGKPESLHAIPGYEHVVSYNVEQAVLDFKNSNRTQTDKDALEAIVDAEISQWAGLWNVREWDVINETLSCHLLMDILGYDQMANWFKLAEANRVNPSAMLFLNDYKIVSAPEEDPGIPDYLSYNKRKTDYMKNIDRILADEGPIGGIGFQNRYTWGVPDPATTYQRLEEFGSKYNMPMVGTEFEVVDNPGDSPFSYDFDELERARITEETLTAYYSHPLTTGLFNWTFMDKNDEKALTYYDGTVKLNGLVWYYLHRIRYHTDEEATSSAEGKYSFNAFKGIYEVAVEYADSIYRTELDLTKDTTHRVVISTTGTGIGQAKQTLPGINVYPNPVGVGQQLYIESQIPIKNIDITDQNGNVLFSPSNSTRVDLSNLEVGTYFLLFRTDDDVFGIKKIVKSN
jgi:GH35 family endo-1,4-beta-xylanase